LLGKCGAVLVSAGGGGCVEVEACMLRFLRAMGCWTVRSVGAEAFRLLDPQLAPEALRKAAMNADRFRDQENELAHGAQFMRELVTQRQEDWKDESAVWQA
jgi:hypothetical protein